MSDFFISDDDDGEENIVPLLIPEDSPLAVDRAHDRALAQDAARTARLEKGRP